MTLAHAAVPAGSWSPDPTVLLALAVAGLTYAVGFVRRCGAGRWRAGGGRALAFAGAAATLGLALASPLEDLSSTLFSAHMVQHLLLITVAAPLLVAARPGTVTLAALPRRGRRALHRLAATRLPRTTAVWLIRPLTAWVLATAVLWTWHLPMPYELALGDDVVHALEHATLLATAALAWWLVATRRGRFAIGRPAAVLLAFAAGLQGSALGAVLAFASSPLYPAHAGGAGAFGLTPLADQQLAGMLMWVPPGVVYLAATVVLLVRWFADLEANSRVWAAAETKGDR